MKPNIIRQKNYTCNKMAQHREGRAPLPFLWVLREEFSLIFHLNVFPKNSQWGYPNLGIYSLLSNMLCPKVFPFLTYIVGPRGGTLLSNRNYCFGETPQFQFFCDGPNQKNDPPSLLGAQDRVALGISQMIVGRLRA